MRYANVSDKELDFVLDGLHCRVPVGGEVEIPERLAFAVQPRGLPLEPVPEPVEVDPPAEVVEVVKRRPRRQ